MSLVWVRRLEPLPFRGTEELIAHSRVQQGDHLAVGAVVHVRYTQRYYKALVVDVDGKCRVLFFLLGLTNVGNTNTIESIPNIYLNIQEVDPCGSLHK